MKLFLFFLAFYIPYAVAAPEGFMQNQDIKTNVQRVGDKRFYTFGFKDLTGQYQEWSWSDDAFKMEELARAFGLYNKDPQNFTYDPDELPGAYFKEHFTLGVIPDYSALVTRYYYSVKELHRNWKLFVDKAGLNQRQSLELLLRFLQDFPYGVPPTSFDGRLIGGLFVPPLVFKNGWGDCDSKSLIMATVLAHDHYFRDKVALVMVPGHALIGIEMIPGPYDEYYTYQGRKYVVAEPTGLARTPLGRKNSPYSKLLGVERLTLNTGAIFEEPPSAATTVTETSNTSSTGVLKDGDCPDGGLLLDYESKMEGGRVLSCRIKSGADYIKHGPSMVLDGGGTMIKKEVYNQGKKVQ